MWLYLWLAVIAIAVIVELITVELVSVWFVPSGGVALILAATNVHPAVQIGAFIVLTVLFLVFLRKPTMRLLARDTAKTNKDSLIGKTVTLTAAAEPETPGELKINGVVWSAAVAEGAAAIPAGTKVKVEKIEGNKLVVSPVSSDT